MLNEWTTRGSHRAPRSSFMIIPFWLICIKLQWTNEICIKVRTRVAFASARVREYLAHVERNTIEDTPLFIYAFTLTHKSMQLSVGSRLSCVRPTMKFVCVCVFTWFIYYDRPRCQKSMHRWIGHWLGLIRYYVPRIRLTSDGNGTRVMSMQTHYNQPIESPLWRKGAETNTFLFFLLKWDVIVLYSKRCCRFFGANAWTLQAANEDGIKWINILSL